MESFLGEFSGAEVYHAQVAVHQRAAVPSPKWLHSVQIAQIKQITSSFYSFYRADTADSPGELYIVFGTFGTCKLWIDRFRSPGFISTWVALGQPLVLGWNVRQQRWKWRSQCGNGNQRGEPELHWAPWSIYSGHQGLGRLRSSSQPLPLAWAWTSEMRPCETKILWNLVKSCETLWTAWVWDGLVHSSPVWSEDHQSPLRRYASWFITHFQSHWKDWCLSCDLEGTGCEYEALWNNCCWYINDQWLNWHNLVKPRSRFGVGQATTRKPGAPAEMAVGASANGRCIAGVVTGVWAGPATSIIFYDYEDPMEKRHQNGHWNAMGIWMLKYVEYIWICWMLRLSRTRNGTRIWRSVTWTRQDIRRLSRSAKSQLQREQGPVYKS